MKSLKWMLALASALLITACGGGGGNAGTSPFGSGTCSAAASASGASAASCSSAATTIELVASSVQVGSGGDTVTVTAVVKGNGNVSLAGAPVLFSTNSGTLTQTTAVTNAAGIATATFAAGADRSNRTAKVTAKSGASTADIDLQIVGTTLSYQGVTTIPLAGVANLSVIATDSKGALISNLPIAVTSSLSNGLSAPSITTNAQGSGSVGYTATNAGVDTLSFAGAGLTLTSALQVSSAQFSFVSPAANAAVTVGTPQPVTVRYLVSGAPVSGQAINFSTTAGQISPPGATTNAAGEATVTVSSSTASPAAVQATVAGGAAQATLSINFVAQAPASLVLQVSPTAVGPNPAGATAQQAQLRAVVRDVNGNPVAGTLVAFTRLSDPSGGNLSQASTATDSSGQATVQYIAGASTTANNGVQLRASVLGTPGVFGDATLTVNQSALFIALATGNTISNLDPQTYKKDYVIYVTDSNGVAVPNINLTVKVLPIEYRKGRLIFANQVWTYDVPSLFTCINEDAVFDGATPADPRAFNGVRDAGEDLNGDGVLQPGNVISVTPGTARTDAAGRATVSLLYGESYVPWVRVRLIVQAIVSGTESTTDARFVVDGLASDFNSATNPPAGVISPFGTQNCSTPN